MFKYENALPKEPTEEEEEETRLRPPEDNKKLPEIFQEFLGYAEDFVSEETERHSHSEKLCVFLAWDALMQFLAELDVTTRVAYCNSLESPLVNNVLMFLFVKLPDPPGNRFWRRSCKNISF